MSLEEIVSILNEKIGLNPSSIGTSSIERAVNHRISCRNCINVVEYSKLLVHDAMEMRELIEEVVVPETWFFRNKGTFEAFRKHVKQELLPKCNKRKPLRLLSVPCATGEEPYSLAIALIDENIDPQAFCIDAIDVSKKAIELAKDAHYGKNSFRDMDPELREKYFTSTERGWQLNEAIRKLVNFEQGNILQDSLSPHPAFYDVVFCRNLLIYFDRNTQQRTLEKIYRSLKKGAILFVGHAECSQVSDRYYQRTAYPKSFSFIKRDKPLEKESQTILTAGAADTKNAARKTPVKAAKRLKKSVHRRAAADSATGTGTGTGTGQSDPHTKPAVIDSLRPVEKLADQGRYQDAENLCSAYLLIHPDSAHGHYLLGLIKNALSDQKTAESLLKKAIYLDPNHEQALVLSALLAEQKGDTEAAQAFKRRIERVKNRSRQNDR